ncbi:hypothetical protein DPX16_10378 [Anabarilius grahami]|uniref:Uncharacterized protein n=1 Tax=Anabarilius grahami TaxID=495550 RepID=A0A3N0Y4U8_ANAGA|nr:hypothetical protein DPX16_10378 [Anabarilius grahami]
MWEHQLMSLSAGSATSVELLQHHHGVAADEINSALMFSNEKNGAMLYQACVHVMFSDPSGCVDDDPLLW